MNPQRSSTILKLEPNVPTELALENPTGLEVPPDSTEAKE
jgi:hypothetical protein